MNADSDWPRLIRFLNLWATADEVAPGRLEVVMDRPDDTSRIVEILVTADQWDEMLGIIWADNFDAAAQHVREQLQAMSHEKYLLYGQYELTPSTRPYHPPDPDQGPFDQIEEGQPGAE